MLLRVVIALVKIAQQLELQIVRVAFDRLESRIHLARGFDVGPFAQLFHHREHGFRCLVQQFDLFAKLRPSRSCGQIKMRSPIFSTVFGIL